MEPGWNPMLEFQAIDRVHRLGQTKKVEAIRYIVPGQDSVEEVSGTPAPPARGREMTTDVADLF